MVLSITSNVAAFNAQGNIGSAANNAAAAIARLSSGNRITKASDDVAGLATGTSLRTQVTTLRTSLQNATQGTSLLQVADGGLSQIVDILQRQKAIAVQAGSGSLTDANRALLNQEFTALNAEADRIASGTSFNGVNLLSGGLGVTPVLAATDALAASMITATDGLDSGTYNPSVRSISGVSLNDGTGINLRFVDASGVTLANGALLGTATNSAQGKLSNFIFTNVDYATGTATLTATFNGVQYSAGIQSSGSIGSRILYNAAGTVGIFVRGILCNLTDPGAQSQQTQQINSTVGNGGFNVVGRTGTIQGVDFGGTALAGAVGAAATGNVSLRTLDNGTVTFGNFQYVSNTGSANSNVLTVQINGRTFTASGVNDTIAATGNGKLQFTANNGAEVLALDMTGMIGSIANIRTSASDQQAFISALNTGFARAGTGLNFTVGSTTADTINVNYSSAGTVSVYGEQTLDVSSANSAANAATVLDAAVTKVISLRATVGALQSRFNFAANAIQSSIENQDNARSQLLDTDVGSESTNFASAQVQLRAGIAVLAQANKLPSDLLKLIQ